MTVRVQTSVALLFAAVAAWGQETTTWPDTSVARWQAAALLQTLNAEVLASRSATATLESWCRDHRLASEPRIRAEAVKGAAKEATGEVRERLQVGPEEVVKYRRVRLRCGERVLSEADNWYVPGRLTAEMNRLLETTDTPFGRAVQPLEPYRRTYSMKVLWSPTTGAGQGSGALPIPEGLFEHRAVLYTREHKPFSEVVEVYRRDVLGASPPR
jgi:chorismate-pyruvate lyase